MATAKEIMTKAISYLGVKESPPNSNNVIFNTHYYGREVSGSKYPWCCAYVYDIFKMCNASKLFYDGQKTAYCPTVASWGKSKDLTVDKTKGQYGDIVLFDWGKDGLADHIGFIEKNKGNGVYDCIEGNTSVGNDSNGGCVMRRERNVSQIYCIIRPKYDTEETKTTTKKEETKTTTTETKKTETTTKKTLPQIAIPTILFGTKGANAKCLQKDLNYLGFKGKDGKKLTEDGDIGKNSDYAIRQYQKKYKLQVDGIYGTKSYLKMKSVIK